MDPLRCGGGTCLRVDWKIFSVENTGTKRVATTIYIPPERLCYYRPIDPSDPWIARQHRTSAASLALDPHAPLMMAGQHPSRQHRFIPGQCLGCHAPAVHRHHTHVRFSPSQNNNTFKIQTKRVPQLVFDRMWIYVPLKTGKAPSFRDESHSGCHAVRERIKGLSL